MKDTIRTFIAVKITPEKKLLDLIADCRKSLKEEQIRWVDSNNLHLTLRFIGETSAEQVAAIIKILDSVSKDIQPFQFEFKGLSIFKKRAQPNVLFLSVENDLILKQLAADIFEKLKMLGFEGEMKSYYPHLTLGRMRFIKDKNGFLSLIKKFSDAKIQQVIISEIIFYQSILSSDGPTYVPIKIVKLI